MRPDTSSHPLVIELQLSLASQTAAECIRDPRHARTHALAIPPHTRVARNLPSSRTPLCAINRWLKQGPCLNQAPSVTVAMQVRRTRSIPQKHWQNRRCPLLPGIICLSTPGLPQTPGCARKQHAARAPQPCWPYWPLTDPDCRTQKHSAEAITGSSQMCSYAPVHANMPPKAQLVSQVSQAVRPQLANKIFFGAKAKWLARIFSRCTHTGLGMQSLSSRVCLAAALHAGLGPTRD